jgi:glycosyltransferase involved in cell wall biosynthesis
MISYNHEKFIAQAIESVVTQKTQYSFELIIGDDFSTDHTRDIILSYQEKYPEIVKLLHSDSNIGMLSNFIKTFNACDGKYIALLEGDDYWTDQLKLEKQISFLESNPEFSICFHKMEMLNENTKKATFTEKQKDITTIEDLAINNYISTPSCVFKNKLFDEFPSIFLTTAVGDYFLHMLNAQHGKIKYIDEVMATYRIHNAGVWSTKSNLYRMAHWIKVLEPLIDYFEGKVKENLIQSQAQYLSMIAHELKHHPDDETFTTLFPNLPKSYFVVFDKIRMLEFQLKQQKLKYRIRNFFYWLIGKQVLPK